MSRAPESKVMPSRMGISLRTTWEATAMGLIRAVRPGSGQYW